MICPHCKKAVDLKVDRKAIPEARKLRKQGFSLRDISFMLSERGYRVSHTQVATLLITHERGEKKEDAQKRRGRPRKEKK